MAKIIITLLNFIYPQNTVIYSFCMAKVIKIHHIIIIYPTFFIS